MTREDAMPVKCEEYGQVCVIALQGEFGGSEAEQVQKLVEQRLKDRRWLSFVIDFEHARFISSDGLEGLLAVRRRCEERRGQVRLAGLDENCKKILQITRLDHRFESYADPAGALKAAA
jgi:anti-anti-sigma factor